MSSEAVTEALEMIITLAYQRGVQITTLTVDLPAFKLFMEDKMDNILMTAYGPVTIQGEEHVRG